MTGVPYNTRMPGNASAQDQTADAVMMLRPACFGWNPETAESNRFQSREPPHDCDVAERATGEFNGALDALRAAGIECHAFDDRAEARCPDAVFPNNWVSLHTDGTVVLYPLLAAARRRERRLDLLEMLRYEGNFVFTRLVDLSHHELNGRFLEGTGSVVFDHSDRLAYAARSARTHPAVLEELCAELDSRPQLFTAVDAGGAPVYHTNVILTIGEQFVLYCAEAVATQDRERIAASLAASGRSVLPISHEQVRCYAGNMLELRSTTGERVLVMSAAARSALGERLLDALSAAVDRIVVVEIPTIEQYGGGSVRCMLAEVFLPRTG